MAIHVALSHITHYRYDRLVKLGPQVVRLRPAPHSRTKVLSYSQRIEPEGHFINWQQDPFANYQARLVFPEPTTEFKVTIDLVVEMAVYNPFDFFLEPSAENFPFKYDDAQKQELAPYLATAPLTPLLKAYVDAVDRSERRTIDFLVEINQRLQRDIAYTIRMEPGVQTPEDTLKLKSGSCRDSGWLLVQILRHMGLAARFVSGYLIQLTADVKSVDGPNGPEKDFTDLHAWCEVYLPGAGWIGLDPTSGLLTGESHIPLAATPHYRNAAPIAGGFSSVGTPETEFAFDMQVSRVAEHVTDAAHRAARRQVVRLLAKYRKIEELVQIGAYAKGSDAEADVAITFVGEINSMLQQGHLERPTAAESRARLLDVAVRAGAELDQATKRKAG